MLHPVQASGVRVMGQAAGGLQGENKEPKSPLGPRRQAPGETESHRSLESTSGPLILCVCHTTQVGLYSALSDLSMRQHGLRNTPQASTRGVRDPEHQPRPAQGRPGHTHSQT